jgi:hypothetical protein
MNLKRRAAAILVSSAVILAASQTRTWTQSGYTDFEKGVIKNLSVRSDGLLTLAPRSHELMDTPAGYLWALAQDSKGNLYTAGGPGAKLFRIAPGAQTSSEKPKPVADLDALGIQALAVDARDRVYAATAPDGKIYRIAGSAKPEVFYEPKAKYIWAMAFNGEGDLFVATGDPGGIDRVTPDGKGKVFFKTDQTHVRSLAVDANQNLIAGTDPGGLVLRVSPQGQGFVLYQMSKPEVTAVAVARDGSIYAAAVGAKGASSPATALPPPAAQVVVNVPGGAAPGGQAGPGRPVPAPAPTPAPPAGVAGGSEVYRIEPNGNPVKEWSQGQDAVYAIAFDASDRPVLGAGNHGNLYRIESPTIYTALLTVPAAQITALQKGRDGRLFAATGNVGKVYEIGPGLEHEGSIESEVFDASMFSLWGRLSFEARLNGGKIAIQTRSGNLDQPQENWSSWSAPVTESKGAPVASPASRFVQWRATLTADSGGRAPELDSVDVAYLPKNVAPRIEEIETTPANYKFPAPVIPLVAPGGPPSTLNLPPLGKRPAAPAFPVDSAPGTPAMSYGKGFIGARWSASDPNGDAMVYTVEIRGEKETEWKPLKEKIAERYISWDSTAFPDGDYRLRITASDAPGNPPSEALTARMESDPFTIDNTPPRITGLAASRNGGKLEVHWRAADALSNITKAEYSLDGGDWTVAAPVTKLSDSPELDYSLTLDAPAGEHTIAVRAVDEFDNLGVEKIVVR